MIIKVVNYLIFQIGWFIIAILHNTVAAFVGLTFAIANYIIIYNNIHTIYWCCVAAALGICNDILFSYLGILGYADSNSYMTLWMSALWFLFISIIPCSLAWINNLTLAWIAVLGGVGGSIADEGGAQFGAVIYHGDVVPAYVFHFINWFLLFPILVKIVNIKDKLLFTK